MSSLESRNRIYPILLIKVIVTLGICIGPLDIAFSPFSIVTVFYSFALAYDAKYRPIAIVLFFAIVIVVLLSLITMLLGLFFRRTRKVSAYLSTIATFIDLIVSFFVSSVPFKIACIIVSAISTALCISSLKHKY